MESNQTVQTDFKVRSAKGSDLNFIYSTWLESFRYDSHLGRSCRNVIYFDQYPRVVDYILVRSKVLVVCYPQDEDVIFGYIVYEPMIAHYLFVKQAFRNLGIAKMLYIAAGEPKVYTHQTRMLDLGERDLVYNPLKLFKGVL